MLVLLTAGCSAKATESKKVTLAAADDLARSLVKPKVDKVSAADKLARSLVAKDYQQIINGAERDDPHIRYKAVDPKDPGWSRKNLQKKGIPLRAGRPEATGLRAKREEAEHERITSYIASGGALAQVPACKAALARAHLNATCKPPRKGHEETLRLHAVFSKTAGLAYFKTAKAGSVSFQHYFTERYNDSHCTLVKHCSGTQLPLGELPDRDHIFGFTFVRDPLERALAGYAEVDAVHSRTQSKKERDEAIRKAGTTYTSVPRKHGTHGTARFLAYLDDLAHNRIPPEWKPGHSCPESDFLRAEEHAWRYGFVGRIEDLDKDWKAMQQLAGVPPAKRTNAESVPRDHQGKNHDYLLNEATQRSDEVLRRVCHLYEADYACFGYDRPDACTPAHLR